ncbi:hypothetical protein Vi05172_g1552 [Venturia inaequalis]|nr:hypothetical protein Vi05172_g1552 [Venturia inaequalis]
MAKLRSASRTRSRSRSPPQRHATLSKPRPMEETTIGKAYASPFLALISHIDGEVAHTNATTPLHGFSMPPDVQQLEKEITASRSPLREIGNHPLPTTPAVQKPFHASRGRIAPTPVPGTSDEVKELENPAPASKAAWIPGPISRPVVKDAIVECEQQLGAVVESTANGTLKAVICDPVSAIEGGGTGDVFETPRSSVETKSAVVAPSTVMEDVDIGEVLRAYWMKDKVFHRRLAVRVK